MSNALNLDFKTPDDLSDAYSTSAASVGNYPYDEVSPLHGHSSSSLENDTISKSKKIRKKRNAYQKIDDDIRLQLLEAVQRGETLKSAAKRYQVNYSSAKSIFHIYRKEGRILKKATQDKDFGMVPLGPESDVPQQMMPNVSNIPTMPTGMPNMVQIPMQPFFQRSIFPQSCQIQDFRQDNGEEGSGCSSPLNNLVDNFSELLKIGGSNKPQEEMVKPINFISPFPMRFLPKMMSPAVQPSQQQQMSLASKPPANPSPAERMKQFDNFYMNYSNSPLSGNARMIREGSESGSNRYIQGEFDSFSEMVNAFQAQGHLADSLKFINGMGVSPAGKIERKQSAEDDLTWGGNIENAALDTYKSFIDAQVVLSNAFRKASYLNNLVQFQKKMDASPSPKFLTFPGN